MTPTAESVTNVVAALRSRQPEWEALPVNARVRWLSRYRDWLWDNQSRLEALLIAETGKPAVEAGLEIPYIVQAINYHSRRAPRVLADRRPRPHGMLAITKRQLIVQRPYQVVGVITPWNFPLGLSLLDAVPALLAGCAVVVKPSELTPAAVSAAVAGWAEIGAPQVLDVVCGDGRAGNAVVAQVDFVQFTGSVRTGRAIARAAADRLIPCALELGGKDAMIVLDDADVTRAANAAVWGAMANCGQMCVSVERVYVESAVYDEFVSQVTAKVAALRPGIDMGRFTNPAQTEVMRRHVDDALSRGATALVSGHGGHGPTVLAGVDHRMLCMTEETFGPTLPVVRVSDEDEAVRLANESRYGLSAAVFSGDRHRAERIARRIDAGAVNINDVFANLFTLALPQSGWKESGLGTRGGSEAVSKFCRPQAIVAARVTPARELTWYPYTPLRGAAMRRVSRLIGARGFRRRFG
ncbi:betaine-aldehyde dehydrogenase [Mycolicibacterium sp. BK556]|uniref:aldehyde dehydrogenase family protein n=1 Tax=Mycobacteriaceae TaxID=1762 RepID=UPI00105CDCA1|nr:aldehyde dehydrogenase family protein [Mycobacterium sp. BK086]MBB3604998.1 betaine-aldehyde dehydrogenase [Mycolicibacterium sp. BK556]MBB3635194.1 betaine-aldehyde dehydrogenase [Mycolicibacterium sp. BK607]TDO07853.1 betaine-aldehyde dehydrogenase [Mycobacterium sp. BK086]